MNYWIFKANPDKYDIEKHLAYHDRRVTWRIENHKNEIKNGDIAFIWRTGNKLAIIGIMDIDSNPARREEFAHESQFHKVAAPINLLMVSGIFRQPKKEISRDTLKLLKETSDLSVFMGNKNSEFTVGTNYRVTREQGNKIMELLN